MAVKLAFHGAPNKPELGALSQNSVGVASDIVLNE